ncbi:MAG: cation-translocating P-type ATPase [Spirochaetia bacterium]|nr:cation-translocating P-type ATPase [Spirochaetia bacterium]
MDAYHKPITDILNMLKTDATTGLTSQQAAIRLEQDGPNKLQEKKKKSTIHRFLLQFKDTMILILIAAALISFALAVHEGSGFFEPLLILVIVTLNAILGVAQENKAEKALDALKSITVVPARVVRNGSEEVIEAWALVKGDIIILDAGDIPPADARLIREANLLCDESALTGESLPVHKDSEALVAQAAPLGDRFTMVYSGCPILGGTAKAVVTATGSETEMGKIASLMEGEDDQVTPLQLKLSSLGKKLGIAAIVACTVIFIIGLLDNMSIREIFLIAVSLAVSAIPEGLPAIVTVILAIGVQRMVKSNAIIRTLPAVETLGSASVICSDKTGTLTQNRMTVTQAYVAEATTPQPITEANSEPIRTLLSYATLASDATVDFSSEEPLLIGDPTETALIMAAKTNGMDQGELNLRHRRLETLPFDSDRKMMTSINTIDGKIIVIVKGAFESIAPRCPAIDLPKAEEIMEGMGEQALRVLAIAYKEIPSLPSTLDSETLESNLTFMGLVGMIDPPCEEAKEAIRLCNKAGIRVVMITGDHLGTAKAIAWQLGILSPGDLAIDGQALVAMDEKSLNEAVHTISVYARVSPSDKIRIVKAWQNRGDVVAMTGDGVNDAPALKAADIGCAMGITGTEVAKGAADMTLTDDNFATIVEAVRQGRGIYANLKKVVGYLLSTNIAELFTVFLAMIIFRQTPLLSMQLLWINLITDSLPAIALGMEPIQLDVMEHKPTSKSESLFANGLTVQIIAQGSLFALLTLVAFLLGWKAEGDIVVGRTMAFSTLAILQLVQAFNMRSQHSLFTTGFFTNATLNKAVLVSALLLAVVLFIPPVANIFALTILSPVQYAIVMGLALLPLPILEVAKKMGLIRYLA